jgi:hypothetical protein
MRLDLDTSSSKPTKMKFRNASNKSVIVELLSDDVEVRIGETKWPSVAYLRTGTLKVYVRTKAEFYSKFLPVKDAES